MTTRIAAFVLGALFILPVSVCAQRQLVPAVRAVSRAGVAEAAGKNAAKAALAPSAAAFAKQLASKTAPVHNALRPAQNQHAVSLVPSSGLSYGLEAWLQKHYPKNVNSEIERQNQALIDEFVRVQNENGLYLNHWLVGNLYKPMELPTTFAVKNNKMALTSMKHFFEKMKRLEQFPAQGLNNMVDVYGAGAVRVLAKQLANEKMIVLGESHYLDEVQLAVGELLVELKRQNPSRRIVVFTEFLDLPKKPVAKDASLATYYRRVNAEPLVSLRKDNPADYNKIDYARPLFSLLLGSNFEVYPLEDKTIMEIAHREQGPLYQAETSLLALSLRNKTWARVMESKMAEIRKTDPDALFVVYAGMAHTSWLIPYSIPKFFAPENPAVVELAITFPSDLNALYTLWDQDWPFFNVRFEPSLHYWKGEEAHKLGQYTGFDYMLVVPADEAVMD